ncbi:MAG: isoprenylcysteine carboxylmethyltransferase family protein [Euryarchaeota archaeon]|nr:isoprenylcysteine carboxylmethyltransferase family protein [Euryarchaeota archaeon]
MQYLEIEKYKKTDEYHYRSDTVERKRVTMDKSLKSIWGIAILLMVLETVLFVLFHDPPRVWLGNLGWVILWIAAFLAVIPIFTFRKKGGVAKGKSYIERTTLVNTGLYALVRHPQYLSFILICVGIIMAAQEWLISIIGILATVLIYFAIRRQDRFLVEKFSDTYIDYMVCVPRVNILIGIARWMRRNR